MALAVGTTDVQVSRGNLTLPAAALLLSLIFPWAPSPLQAAETATQAPPKVSTTPAIPAPPLPIPLPVPKTGAPMHHSAQKQYWDRKANRVELIGDAAVHQLGESITADFIILDLDTRTLHAKGNCVYIASDLTMYGEEMYFNLDSRAGTIINGRITNEGFTMMGERINRLEVGKYRAYKAEYSTCQDCDFSWSIEGSDVDVIFEDRIIMKNVIFKVKGAPVSWAPYLWMPIKTKRQTGLLFPRWSASGQNGFAFVLPFYWAINKSSDMTFGLGYFGARGPRLEWEGRYQRRGRSAGSATAFYTRDNGKTAPIKNRWMTRGTQIQELPWKIDQKFRLAEMSDNRYPLYIGDSPNNMENEIAHYSDLSFSRSAPEFSSYIAARRYRNVLSRDPVAFDPMTVQLFPTALLTTNDRPVPHSPFVAGLSLGVTNFTRSGPAYDRDCREELVPAVDEDGNARVNKDGTTIYETACISTTGAVQPGIDPIRKATRVSMMPTLYTTLRPMDVIQVVPALEYRGFFYSFEKGLPTNERMPDLARGYLQFKTDLSTQFEKVYSTSDVAVPRIKHLFRPEFQYSLIPAIHQPKNHPFIQQIDYGGNKGFGGYYFDNNDIVPVDEGPSLNNYFVPQGHSVSYGFTTQLIRRRGGVNSTAPGYQRFFELKAGQAFNIREVRKDPSDRHPFSRLFARSAVTFDKFSWGNDYFYYPYVNRSTFGTELWYFIGSGVRQRVLPWERSIRLSYGFNGVVTPQASTFRADVAYSITDYILPKFFLVYNLKYQRPDRKDPRFLERIESVGTNLQLFSPSRCWTVAVGLGYHPARGPILSDMTIALNLTGSGFGGLTEVAERATNTQFD